MLSVACRRHRNIVDRLLTHSANYWAHVSWPNVSRLSVCPCATYGRPPRKGTALQALTGASAVKAGSANSTAPPLKMRTARRGRRFVGGGGTRLDRGLHAGVPRRGLSHRLGKSLARLLGRVGGLFNRHADAIASTRKSSLVCRFQTAGIIPTPPAAHLDPPHTHTVVTVPCSPPLRRTFWHPVQVKYGKG